MKRVCAWCNQEMGEAAAPPGAITHGICPGCAARYFAGGHPAQELGAFLDGFDIPVVAIDSRMRVLAVNAAASNLIGGMVPDADLRPGEVFDCDYALLPGGCGETVHCSGCAIRLALEETYATGTPRLMMPAYLRNGDREVRLLITTERVCDAVLLQIDDLLET